MGKNQSASNLTNIIKQDASGNITFVSGSTTLMSVSSSGAITTTGNVAGTASYASNAELLDGLDSTVFTLTSSFAAQTASFTAFTASVNTFTASQNILNGTYATTGSNTFEGIQTINSNLTVTGSITAQTLVVQTVTSSVVYSSGSNVFGNNIANTQTFTGSMSVSGGLVVTTTAPELTVGATGVTLGNVLTDVHNVTGSLGVTGSINATATTHSFFGRVGINTLASNIDALWVSGSIGFSTGGGGGLTFADRSGNDLRIYTPSGATRFVDGTGLSTFLTIQSSNGNVGIGTSSPNYQLDLGGGTTIDERLRLQRGSDDTNQFAVYGWNSIRTYRANVSTGSNLTDFSIIQSGSDGSRTPFYIGVTGNIGIGTTSPNEKLQVSGAIAATGTATTSFGSSSTLDWYSTGTRIISRGANTTTRGTFTLKLESSDSSLSSDVLQFSNLGAATFSSTGSNLATFKTNNATDSYNSGIILAGNANATQANRSAYMLLDPNGANGTGVDYGFFTALGTGETQIGTSKSDGFLALYTADTERMRITSAGNVGIGTSFVISSYFAGAQTGGVLQVATNVAKTATANSYPVGFFSSNDATYPLGLYIGIITGASTATRQLKFQGTEIGISPNSIVMQEDGANVLIGTRSDVGQKLRIYQPTNGNWNIKLSQPNSSAINFQEFLTTTDGDVSNTARGSITYNGTNVLYNGTSDYRMKEDLQEFNGLNIVSQLKTYDFKWKEAGTRDYGMMAHELQEVLPNYVTGQKDELNEDGSVKPQGVDYSKLVPVLVKSIQELNTKLDAANAEIEALKNN